MKEDVHKRVYQLYFDSNYLLATAAAIFGVTQTEAVEPWFTYQGTLFAPFTIDLKIASTPDAGGLRTPEFSLQGVPSDCVKLILRLEGTMQYQAGPPVQFKVTATKLGTIRRRNSRREFYADFSTGEALELDAVESVLEGASAVALEIMLRLAIAAYIDSEMAQLPLIPQIAEDEPFIDFVSAQLSSVDSSGGDNALTLTFGAGSMPFDRYIIPETILAPGTGFPQPAKDLNVTFGISRAAALFGMLRTMPDLPFTSADNPDITIHELGVDLATGFVEITGTGTASVPNFFDIDFGFTSKLVLEVSPAGVVSQRVIDAEVDLPAWLDFLAAAIVALLGVTVPGGATIGMLALAIADAMLDKELADTVAAQDINVDVNLQERLDFGLPFGEIKAHMATAQIAKNGIFFHGRIEVDY